MEPFKYIKNQVCPFCGAPAVSDSVTTGFNGRINVHCNGQTWETRMFGCGYVEQWSPNFQRIEVEGRCTLTAHYKEEQERQKDLLKQINTLVDKHQCHEKFKRLVLMYLPTPQ